MSNVQSILRGERNGSEKNEDAQQQPVAAHAAPSAMQPSPFLLLATCSPACHHLARLVVHSDCLFDQRMMEKCFDQTEVKAQDLAEKFNGQESIVRTFKKKSSSVKTSFCQICQKDCVINTNLLFLSHFGLHMRNTHGLVRFSCNACRYTTPHDANIRRHTTAHGEAGRFTDEIEVSFICWLYKN
ncbi:hypothetical protein WR25_05454 [Diploscapter pachys]|uniref:C2H2-type domain-containing protein n=1 Tax=Diploscapter pachys TaxID=2018661 RepID=A0A2A2KML6_9BILA|nr:hypothetical protein WR25_05454 [Diploscapter pachys]